MFPNESVALMASKEGENQSVGVPKKLNKALSSRSAAEVGEALLECSALSFLVVGGAEGGCGGGGVGTGIIVRPTAWACIIISICCCCCSCAALICKNCCCCNNAGFGWVTVVPSAFFLFTPGVVES